MNIPLLSLKDVTAKYSTEIHQAVNNVIDSGWYLQGQELEQFEKKYASYIGTKFCIGVANGLDALTLMIRAYKELGVFSDGDEIIVPANTYIATILAISENNLKPVLVEPNIKTFQIDDLKIEEKISSKTKAIMIVHLYGRCAYTQKISDLCKKYNLILMEDNAQAQGCIFENKKTGCLGDVAAHSFYPGKNLGALGDAGCVTTNDENLASLIKVLANYGSSKKYVFDYIGKNSRLNEINAAVLNVKLKYLDDDNLRRIEVAKKYINNIKNPFVTLPELITNGQNVFHQFPILTERRNEFQQYLKNNGIGTLIHYPIPPHKQRCYKTWNNLSFPITEKIHNQELSIPMNQCLTDEEILYISKIINEWK